MKNLNTHITDELLQRELSIIICFTVVQSAAVVVSRVAEEDSEGRTPEKRSYIILCSWF